MTSDRNKALDAKAPLKYIRDVDKRKYRPDEVKFSYEYDFEVTETIVETDGTTTKTITKKYTDQRTKKVILWIYKHSSDEDPEHFFECFFGKFLEK